MNQSTAVWWLAGYENGNCVFISYIFRWKNGLCNFPQLSQNLTEIGINDGEDIYAIMHDLRYCFILELNQAK